MQVVGCILMLFGLIVMSIGICIWKKQKINWISVHSKVKTNDTGAFTQAVGWSTIGFGSSVFCMGLFWFMNRIATGAVVFTAIFILSLVLYSRAQKRFRH